MVKKKKSDQKHIDTKKDINLTKISGHTLIEQSNITLWWVSQNLH